MKKVIFISVFILLAAANIFAGGFEFTLGGGFNGYKLEDLKSNYEDINDQWASALENDNITSIDYFDEHMLGESYFFEAYYRILPKLRVGAGFSHMRYDNSAREGFYDPVAEVTEYVNFKEEIKYNLFYLSAKYNLYRGLYAGLRAGIGYAEFDDSLDAGTGGYDKEYDLSSLLLMPSLGVEMNVLTGLAAGTEIGYRHFPLGNIDDHYPNRPGYLDELIFSDTIDLDSSGFFLNMFVVVRM